MTDQYVFQHASAADRPPGLIFPSLAGFYATFSPITYALLRIAFGLVILTHGIPKAFGLPHGSMANPMASATNLIANVLHLPAAPQIAFVAMLLETVGAIGVAAGAFTRFFAAALAVEMAVICYLHGPTFNVVEAGYEYSLVLGFISLHIAIKGGGRYAVDHLLPKTL